MKRMLAFLLTLVMLLGVMPGKALAASTPFTDVPDGIWYEEPVKWAVDNDITKGMSSTTFGPDLQCTRAQVVTFLWRAAGSPETGSAKNPFTDVSNDIWYADAVLWAVANNITQGMTSTTFGPDVTCTRAQVVTFLQRFRSGTPSSTDNPFTDVPAGQWYTNAVLWAVENGITQGMSSTTFGPDMQCTRAQIVTFLYRCMKSTEAPEPDVCRHTYDNACDATCNSCGATRTPAAHVYDNACDATCNTCGAKRTPAAHAYDNACDATCNSCGAKRTAPHVYDNACDKACNDCGVTRTTKHNYVYSSGIRGRCTVCNHAPIWVEGITLDKAWVQVGDTFTATVDVSNGEAPYTVKWVCLNKQGDVTKEIVINAAGTTTQTITATEEMFNTSGKAYIYCSVTDAEGYTLSADEEVINKMGKLKVNPILEKQLLDDYWEWSDYGYAIYTPYASGGNGTFTYKWEYSRDKVNWTVATITPSDVNADFEISNLDDKGAASFAFTKAGLDAPMYVRVTVTSGGQTVTSNISTIYKSLEVVGAEAEIVKGKTSAEDKVYFRAITKGGYGETEYDWYILRNGLYKTFFSDVFQGTAYANVDEREMFVLKYYFEDEFGLGNTYKAGNYRVYCNVQDPTLDSDVQVIVETIPAS